MLKLLLSITILAWFSGDLGNSSEPDTKRITVVGIAENSKAAAVVVTDKGNYFVDGLDAWDKKFYQKKVKVTGRLVIREHAPQSTPTRQVQERVGKWQVLKRPKWELVE